MKAIIMALLAALISWFSGTSQSLTDKVGLPSEFGALENCVLTGKTSSVFALEATYTFKRVGTKRVIDTAWSYVVQTKSDNSITGYGLNWVHNYIHSFGYKHDGGMNLKKDAFTAVTPIGPFAGQTYYHGYRSVTTKQVPGGYDITVKGYPFKNANKNGYPATIPWEEFGLKYINKLTAAGSVNYGTKIATKPWLESKLGVTEAWLAENTYTTYHFRTVDPSTHVTSIFGYFDKTGEVYTNATLINGKHYKSINYQVLKTPWGNPLGELNFSWVLYNECEIPAVKPSDANSTGNFGECFRKMYASSDPRSLSITIIPGTSFSSNASGTITYNSTKKAALQLVPHRNPMPEKNTEQEGYWSLTNNQRVQTLQGL